MIVNVRDYVERWYNNYIVYHSEHLKEYGDIDRANLYFNMKYQEQIGKMQMDAKIDQIKTIQRTLKSQGPKAAEGIKVLDQLENGNLLEKTMELIARGINEGIEMYHQQMKGMPFDEIIRQAKSFSKALNNGSMNTAQVDEFFNLLLSGMTQAGKFNKAVLDALTDIGSKLSGTKYEIPDSWKKKATVQPLTIQDTEMAQKIIDQLNAAVDRFQAASYVNSSGKIITKKSNTLNHTSFSSTINNIFSTVIGERVSRTLYIEGIKLALQDADSILSQLANLPANQGRLIVHQGSQYNLGGMRKDIEGRTSKVDIFNQRAFYLSVAMNGKTYDIEIGTNTSVKWYKNPPNEKSQIHLVAGTPLGSYFKSGTPERYLAYNVMAHRWHGQKDFAFHEAYRIMRASISATFLNEWMTGTGTAIANSKQYTNKVQYLMINGKVYSVLEIIKNICNEFAHLNSWDESKDMPVKMSVSNKKMNSWVGSTSPNLKDAQARSDLTNAVINKLTISMHLNGHILTKYAY